MALFTKLFDRSHDPYSIPGARWYKMKLSVSIESLTVLSSDFPEVNEGKTGPSYEVITEPYNVFVDFYNFIYVDHEIVLLDSPAYISLDEVYYGVIAGDENTSFFVMPAPYDEGVTYTAELYIYGIPSSGKNVNPNLDVHTIKKPDISRIRKEV